MEIIRNLNNISERNLIGNLLLVFSPPFIGGTRAWAESNRWLTSKTTERQGKMDCMLTPWMLYFMDCLDDPRIKVIVGRKSAQVAWTETVNSYIGRIIATQPRNILIAFARRHSANSFYKEKLLPYIESTPSIAKAIGSMGKVSASHIPFKGGFLKLVTAGAAADLKSSVIQIIIVEEPDDVKDSVDNQGNGIDIVMERLKTITNYKVVYGGTPALLDNSQVEFAFSRSNMLFYEVPCHLCGVSHPFDTTAFENLKCDVYQDRYIDKVYGKWNPETAYYECPNCKGIWTFEEKNTNVVNAINFHNKGWKSYATRVTDVYGFSFNELLSPFPKSHFVELLKKKIIAEKEFLAGKPGKLISYTNNTLGAGYRPPQIGLDIEKLKLKRINYPESIVPYEGLILTCGIDVQRNRFAIVVRAWGRGGNSWLVQWTEIFGDVMEYGDPVWDKLETVVLQKWEHATGEGRYLTIQAGSIDSSDGATCELVYRWTIKINNKLQQLGQGKYIYAIKGVGIERNTDHEVYLEPTTFDPNTNDQIRKSLAERMGVTIYPVGVHRAHSEILRRINLKGSIDRYYHNETTYGEYEEGLLSCYQLANGAYKKKPSANKEVIDCEIYAFHASKAIGIHRFTDDHWNMIETAFIDKVLI